MIVAFKLEELLPPRERSSNPDNLHRSFRPRVREADHLSGRNHRLNLLCDLYLQLGSCSKHGPVLKLVGDGADDCRVSVPEDKRAIGDQKVHILVLIKVANSGPQTVLEENGERVVSVNTDIRRRPRWNMPSRFLVCGVGSGEIREEWY